MAVGFPTGFDPRSLKGSDDEQDVPDTSDDSAGQDLINLLNPVKKGYVPLPTNVQEPVQGSVFMANLQDSTSWGSFIGTSTASKMVGVDPPSAEDALNAIPDRHLLDNADKYAGKDLQDFPIITAQLDDEQRRAQLRSEYPVRSFAYGLVQQPLDPLNWFAAGEFLKTFNSGSRILKGMAGVGISSAVSSGVQEEIIQQNNLSKTAQESFYDVAASGVIGAVLGGIGTGISIKRTQAGINAENARRELKKETLNVFTDTEKTLTENGTLPPQELEKMPEVMRKSMVLTPMNRNLNSPFKTARYFANIMNEHNYTLDSHLSGESSGETVERSILTDKRIYGKALMDVQDVYYNMVGINKGPFKSTRAKMTADMTMDKFLHDVTITRITGKESPNAHVNEAARILNNKVYEPIRNELVNLGLLGEDQSPENAVNYLMQVWNKDLIIEQGGRGAREDGTAPKALHGYFKDVQEKIKTYKESPLYNEQVNQINELKTKLAKAEQKKAKIKPDNKKAINDSKKAVKEIKDRIKEHEKTIKDNAPRGSLNSKGKLRAIKDDEQLWIDVEQAIDSILGDNAGQLLNPILQKLSGLGSPSPLKERVILADQESLAPWLVTDASKLTEMYIRATVPYIKMTKAARRLGFESFEDMRTNLGEQLKAEFDEMAKGKTGKEAQKLRAKRDEAIRDMGNTIDMLMGVYGDGPNVLNKSSREYYRNFLKWNYVRLLGFMTISSFADAGIQVFTHGPYRFIHEGLLQSFSDVRKISKRDLRDIGYAVETIMGHRIKSFTETEGLSTNPGPFSRGLDALTQKFGNLTLMNQWNDWHQSMAGHMSISRTLETIANVIEGNKVSQKDLTRVARLGIDKEHYKTIYDFTKNNVSDGSRYADWGNWDIQTKQQAEALRQFQSSVGKEIDSIVITPGLGDKIQYGFLDSHTPAGKLLLQFKTFLSAATNKVLYSGIQRRDDINVYSGVVAMLGMGALSYVTASAFKGKDPDLSIGNLGYEAVDKSGMLGIFGEVPNIFGKLLGFGGVSRYQSRDLWGALTGPSGGALSEMLSIINKTRASITDGEQLNTRDARKMLRLLPLQNLFYLNQINQKIVKDSATSIGFENKDPDEQIKLLGIELE